MNTNLCNAYLLLLLQLVYLPLSLAFVLNNTNLKLYSDMDIHDIYIQEENTTPKVINDGGDSTHLACEDPNCVDCSSSACSKCQDGYYLSSGRCNYLVSLVVPIICTICIVLPPIALLIIWCVCTWYKRHRPNANPNAQRNLASNEINPYWNQANSNDSPNNLSSNRIPNQHCIQQQNYLSVPKNPNNAEELSLKRKCMFCPSLMIFGKAKCNCFICYRHCNEIRESLKNNQSNKQCPQHLIIINDVFDVHEELADIPTFEDILQARIKDTKDDLEGKCQICFENDSTLSFNCGCKALVCAKCFEKHVMVYKHDICPFCRMRVNEALSDNKIK